MSTEVDIAVIGAGVVGAAVACRLTEKWPSKRVVVLEAGPRPAEGVTSRNSGVIHAGIYYPPASLKARACVRGNALLYEWAGRHGVAHRRCGKLIVARGEKQVGQLEALLANARASGVTGLELVDRAGIAARAPIAGDVAIWSSTTGIVDPTELAASFLAAAEARGAIVLMSHAVTAIEVTAAGRYELDTPSGLIDAEVVVNAAGLSSDDVARMAGVDRYRLHPCRGDYFLMRSKEKFDTLVYPVKEPGSPGLGVHLTIGLDGSQRLGPDTEYVSRKDDFSDAAHKLERFREAARALFGPAFEFELAYDTCGIRPKLRAPHESAEKDFVVAMDRPGLVNMIGIESPGLTASLALADEAVQLLL